MNKFQNVKFKNVDEFLDYLPDNEREIVDFLRDIVFNSLPNPLEKLSYNVPFYHLNSRVCFIWPASVPWGKVEKNGVMLGFCNGNLLHDDINWLEKGDRKQVHSKTFKSIDEIETDIVKAYLFEAVEIDHRLKSLKR
jgi:hypothetical protein